MAMSPTERLLAAVRGEEPDQVPVFLPFKPVYFKKWYRKAGKEPGEDLESQLTAQLEFFRQWPEVVPVLPSPPNQGAVGLLDWLGKKLSSDTPPPSAHWSVDQLRERLRTERTPDPQDDGWMPQGLGQWREYIASLPKNARSSYGGLLWSLQVPGPLAGLGALLSYVDTFRLLYEEPRLVHDLFESHTTAVASWVRAVEDVFFRAGLTPCRLFVYEEMLPMISPRHADEFCAPYTRRIFEAGRTPIKVLHCDNRVSHMPETVLRTGANVYFGNFSDYAELKHAFSGRMALMGNVPSLSILTDGRPEDVSECCRWLIARCGPGGGFILSSGGGFDPAGKTPFENITAMVRSAETDGRYPIDLPASPAPDCYRAVMSAHFSRAEDRTGPAADPVLERIARQTCLGDLAEVRRAVRDALTAGKAPGEVLQQGLCEGIRRATDRFYREDYFFPEVDRAGRAYEAGCSEVAADLDQACFTGTVVIGTMKGSYQESGIRLVEVMLYGAGARVVNLGVGVAPERFVQEAIERDADVIAMAVYFHQHVKLAEQVTRSVRERRLEIKTLVGGMGITPGMIAKLEADAYAASGREAQDKVIALLRNKGRRVDGNSEEAGAGAKASAERAWQAGAAEASKPWEPSR